MSDNTDLWDIQVHIQNIAIKIQVDPTYVKLMKLSWSLNMQKGTISNLKESWPQMNKVDPFSTIDHSHKNTRWIYVSTNFI